MPGADAHETGDERPRRWTRLLADPVFGPFVGAKLFAAIGMWAHNLVAAVLAFELTGSAFVVGAIAAAQFLPQLLFALSTGARADRVNRRRQSILGRIVAALATTALAVWVWTGGPQGAESSAMLACGVFVVGCGYVLGNPALHALVPRLVRPAELASAVTLNALPLIIGRAVGPIAGASIALLLDAGWAFAMAALTNLILIAVLLRIPPHLAEPERTAERTSIRSGLRYVAGEWRILVLLVGASAAAFGADPALTLAPSFAAELRQETDFVGVIASVFGAGAGLAFLVIGRLRALAGTVGTAVIGLGAMSCALIGLALSQSAIASLLLFLLCGAGMTATITSLNVELQDGAPDGFRGRVMSLWMIAWLGARPAAAAFNGGIADLASPQASSGMAAVVVGAAALLCWRYAAREKTGVTG